MNLLGFGTNSIGYSGVIGCVELCDKDDENNALHHRDCVGAVFSSLNIDVNDLSSSNQINIAFLSLFLQLLETGIRPSGYCSSLNTTERAYFVQTWIRLLFTRILFSVWQAGPADTKTRPHASVI